MVLSRFMHVYMAGAALLAEQISLFYCVDTRLNWLLYSS